MGIRIRDSVCFVTGSNRGIGRAIVEELLKSGAAKVYAAARDPDALRDLALSFKGRVLAVPLDVTNEIQIAAAARAAQDTQILINNAGILKYTGIIGAPDIRSAREEMEVNYFGLMNMARAFAPILKKNHGGALVNIASVAGLIGMAGFGTYCATKAAVHSLTQSVRGELKDQGTLVACVYPGPIATDMTAGFEMEKDSPQNVARAIIKGLESGSEEIYPDKFSRGFAERFRQDPKAVEKEMAEMGHQPVGR